MSALVSPEIVNAIGLTAAAAVTSVGMIVAAILSRPKPVPVRKPKKSTKQVKVRRSK